LEELCTRLNISDIRAGESELSDDLPFPGIVRRVVIGGRVGRAGYEQRREKACHDHDPSSFINPAEAPAAVAGGRYIEYRVNPEKSFEIPCMSSIADISPR
jgi:hypothetical protein